MCFDRLRSCDVGGMDSVAILCFGRGTRLMSELGATAEEKECELSCGSE